MLEGSYIMDSVVFQEAYFNIYYGIIVGTIWYRGGFIADDIVSILGFLDSYKLAPY